MPSIVNKEAFNSADDKTKLLLIYGMLKEISVNLSEHIAYQESSCGKRSKQCDARFFKIERRKIANTGLAATGGFVGGLLAMILKIKFWG